MKGQKLLISCIRKYRKNIVISSGIAIFSDVSKWCNIFLSQYIAIKNAHPCSGEGIQRQQRQRSERVKAPKSQLWAACSMVFLVISSLFVDKVIGFSTSSKINHHFANFLKGSFGKRNLKGFFHNICWKYHAFLWLNHRVFCLCRNYWLFVVPSNVSVNSMSHCVHVGLFTVWL